MSDDRRTSPDFKQQDESCDAIDEIQTDRTCDEIVAEIRDKKEDEQFSEPENESKDISPDENRNSQCSYGTENSILSSHLSLQANQVLNGDAGAQNNGHISNPEEICLYEQGPLNKTSTATNADEFDECCNSPLLNGHTVDNDANITAEKQPETNSERRLKKEKRVLSFFKRKPRAQTSPADFSASIGDVVVTIEDPEDLTVLDPQPAKRKTSFNVLLKGWLQPMDNKMNMKVFGSRKAMDEELLRYNKAGWIIHPTSAFRFEITVVLEKLTRKKIICCFGCNLFICFYSTLHFLELLLNSLKKF